MNTGFILSIFSLVEGVLSAAAFITLMKVVEKYVDQASTRIVIRALINFLVFIVYCIGLSYLKHLLGFKSVEHSSMFAFIMFVWIISFYGIVLYWFRIRFRSL